MVVVNLKIISSVIPAVKQVKTSRSRFFLKLEQELSSFHSIFESANLKVKQSEYYQDQTSIVEIIDFI
jgi:hypothetical protein